MIPLISTLYGEIEPSLLSKLANIKLLACDVDGIFSDGRIYMGNDGEELKAFHTLDGYGIKALAKIGITVAIVTGRQSQIVENRMSALGIEHIIQGQEKKRDAVAKIQDQLGILPEQTASVGDDMPDLGMFELSSVKVSVVSGHPYVIKKADYVTVTRGGFGAVREICDLLLQAQGKLDEVYGASV